MSINVKVEKNNDISGLIISGDEKKFALVFLHAFNQSPEDLRSLAAILAENGILVLAPKYVDVADGVNQAINTIRYVRARLGFDNSRIGVAGISLGGTVSLLASTQENIAFVGDFGGWVEMAGLYEFLDKFPKGTPQKMIAETIKAAVGTPQESPDIYSLSSPITYVELINSSVLIIHGEKDDMVPVSQSKVLYEKLKQLGRDVELHVLDAGYLFSGYEKELANITIDFLKRRQKI